MEKYIVSIDVLFYLLSGLILSSGLLVIFAKNAVHSIFFLILVFVISACLMLILGSEFLGLLFIVIYVGAIAVLFLFVIMMLNVKLVELNENLGNYLPVGGFLGIIFLMEVYYFYDKMLGKGFFEVNSLVDWGNSLIQVINIESLGEVIYTYYVYAFMLAGVVLLIAMVGTIVLTLHHYSYVRRQFVYKQVIRSFSNAVLHKK